MKEYRTVANRSQWVVEIKHSRFIATVVPIADYDEGLAAIAAIKKQYSDATHNCYAMVADHLGNQCKYSDDGEPSGTAGAPMLEVIRRKGICHVLVVVTRYFGGIKLGANGLVGAYTQTTAEALDHAIARVMTYSAYVTAHIDYDAAGKMHSLVRGLGGTVLASDYDTGVAVHCVLPVSATQSFQAKVVELTKGNATFSLGKEDYYCYDGNGNC